MQLDSYFEFVSADEIVVCGTRIGIEVILADYFAGMNKGTQLICFGMNKGTGRIKSCVPLVHPRPRSILCPPLVGVAVLMDQT
jgi:hypothetical protein